MDKYLGDTGNKVINSDKTKRLSKISFLLAAIILGGLVFSGCVGGATSGAVARGWSGGIVVDDVLFIGSMQGGLVSVNISDGSRLWAETLEEPSSGGGFLSCAPASTTVAIYGSPSAAADLVYVGGYNGKIYAFNAASGALRWVYPRQGNIGGSIVGGSVAADGKVYFSSSTGKVYALDETTGDIKWDFASGDKIWSTPAIDGDTLYIGSFDKKFYALNTGDGSIRWEFATGGAIEATALVDNGTVYIGSFDRNLYALSTSDGSLKWKFPAENWFWAKPVVYQGVIYVASLDGKVYGIDAVSGHKLVEFDLDNIKKPVPVSSSPVLVGNLIIVAREDGVVYALDTSNNQQRQLANLGEKVYAPLVANRGKVYVHTDKDSLYEIDAQTGAMRELSITVK